MSSPNRRAALVRPGVLALGTALLVGGGAYLAKAQGGKSPVPMTQKAPPADLRQIPNLLEEKGRRISQEMQSQSANFTGMGGNLSGPGLVEVDATPNSPSDEREPVYSPGGDFIAFSSNGVDTPDTNGVLDGKIDALNTEKKYHLWVMNRDGSNQRQVTGLSSTAEKNRNQRRPTWSPDGNYLAYVDSSGVVTGGGSAPQIFVARPFVDSNSTLPSIQLYPPEQRTYFAGNKFTPAWAPTGLAIAFASDSNLDNDPTASAGQKDIFSISPDGGIASLVRITGGAKDVLGRTTNDTSPAYSSVNPAAIFFSSNRDYRASNRLSAGRRIYVVSASGGVPRQVTDPLARGGDIKDVEEKPTLSSGQLGFETLAFQTNTFLDASETDFDAGDRNIWELSVDTSAITAVVGTSAFPALVVSSYGGNRAVSYDVTDREAPAVHDYVGGNIDTPEGVVIVGRTVYIASSDKDRIEWYDLDGGPSPGGNKVVVPSGKIVEPTGMTTDGTWLYVSAGYVANPTTARPKNANKAVYRFDLLGQNGTLFTRGEDTAGAITDGCEGVTFGPDLNDDGVDDLYVSALKDNKVNVYDGRLGNYIRVYTKDGGLSVPTGLAFDSKKNLYVASSANSRVQVYEQDATVPTAIVGKPRTVVPVIGGPVDGLSKPEGVVIANIDGTPKLFVSSYGGGTGNTIHRYDPDTGTVLPAAGQTGSIWLQSDFLEGAGYFRFDSVDTGASGPTPTPTPTVVPVTPMEDGFTSVARVVTNYISSVQNFNNSFLSGKTASQDKSADIEASYSTSVATFQTISQLAFSSGRQTAPAPGPDYLNPTPVLYNKYGGKDPDRLSTDSATTITNDIWITSVLDTTVPRLIPQGAGNIPFPVMAPGPQAPFKAPRTFEQGLTPGSDLKVAFVLRETESGLDTNPANKAVTVSFRTADTSLFIDDRDTPNDSIAVDMSVEDYPSVHPAFTKIPLQVYDDGACVNDTANSGKCLADSADPAKRKGGHERQAAAIAGDGNYYCESDSVKAPVKSPTSAGDFYMDIDCVDLQGNAFTYDCIWGFSTRKFTPATTQRNDLFVSDYTVGQQFPVNLTFDYRFENMIPVESYYLNNPATFVLPGGGIDDITLDNVDVWRTLCRGDVPQDVMDAYKPRVAQQVDPNEDPAVTPRFTATTRNVAVSDSCIIWASPYTGLVYSGPGTLYDAETQQRLTTFLSGGGRLFVTGKSIAYSLTNNGTTSNTFFEQELQSKFEGEAAPRTLTQGPGAFVVKSAAVSDPQFPTLRAANNPDSYSDGARNLDGSTASPANNIGLLKPNASSGTTSVTTAYTSGGTPVGLRIEKTQPSGLDSKVVFFSFGLESVNRRYNSKITTLAKALNIRSGIADGIRQYFKTMTISGSVVDDENNLPLANFLIQASGPGGLFYARTDVNGDFEISGLDPGTYFVNPLDRPLADSIAPNQSYYGGTRLYNGYIDVLNPISGFTFRVIKQPPGTLSGYATTNSGTRSTTADDVALANANVLVRSINESSIFPGGGKYAQLTKTNSSGFYSFSQVPTNVPMEIVINPDVNDIPAESGLRPSFTAGGGQSSFFGKRIVPDTDRPNSSSGGSDIVVPPGDAFVVNDGKPDTVLDEKIPVVVPLETAVSGKVFFGGTPYLNGAVVNAVPVNVAPGVTAPSPVTSNAAGIYVFSELRPGTWNLTSTIVVDGATFVGSLQVVIGGGDQSGKNIKIAAPTISGKVTANGAPAVGATVVLQERTGGTLLFSRTATTDSGGNYVLINVQPGIYRVMAYTGSYFGNSGNSSVGTYSGKFGVAPTINMVQSQLYGRVLLNGIPKMGIEVEELTVGGNSFPVPRFNTTGADGSFFFANGSSASYQFRAIYKGTYAKVGPYATTGGAYQVPDIKLVSQSVTGKVVNVGGSAVANATVEVSNSTGAVVSTTVTDSSGNYVADGLVPGDYTVIGTLAFASGRVTVTLGATGNKTAPNIVLQDGSTGVSTFDVIGRTYAMSVPWEDTTSPSTNNSGATPSTTVVEKAFTIPLLDSTGQYSYALQRFDAKARAFVALPPGSVIKRGEGYLLKVIKRPVGLISPATDATRIPLDYTKSTGKTFTFTLSYVTSVKGDPNNGQNLIGFPFDPLKVSSVNWNTAKVTWPGMPAKAPDGSSWTVATAAAAGVMNATLSTIDSASGNGATSSVMKPYVGYYATTKVDGLQVTVAAP